MTTVRISELPVSNTLLDDDFIVLNTQNIVTQGIEAADFIKSLFDRDLTITGSITFTDLVNFNSDVYIDGTTNFNNVVTFNDEVFFNNVTNLNIVDLNDVSSAAPADGYYLKWDDAAKEYRPGPITINSSQVGNLDEVTTNGNITTNDIRVGGLRVGNVTYPNVDGSIGQSVFSDGNGFLTFGNADLDAAVKRGNNTSQIIEVGGLVAAGLEYPEKDGTNGQAIITDGNGNLFFGDVASGPPSGGTSGISLQPYPPTSYDPGDLWIDSTTYIMYVYDGSWIEVGTSGGGGGSNPGSIYVEKVRGGTGIVVQDAIPSTPLVDFNMLKIPGFLP